MKILSALLCIILILTPLLSLFHNYYYYDFGYQANGAYEQLGILRVNDITNNFIYYLEDEQPLYYFTEQEQAHLQDVKELYKTGLIILQLAVILSIISIIYLAKKPNRTQRLSCTFYHTSVITSSIMLILFILGLNWEWFFEAFHTIFFSGNYTFGPQTLMMHLWGGNFFIYGGVIAAVLTQAGALFLYALALILYRRSENKNCR